MTTLLALLRWWWCLATGETAAHGTQLTTLTRAVADHQRRLQDLEQLVSARPTKLPLWDWRNGGGTDA